MDVDKELGPSLPPLYPLKTEEEAVSPQLTASEAAASPSSGFIADDSEVVTSPPGSGLPILASPAAATHSLHLGEEKPLLPPPPPPSSDPVAAMFAALHAGRIGLGGLEALKAATSPRTPDFPLHPSNLLGNTQGPKMDSSMPVKPEPPFLPSETNSESTVEVADKNSGPTNDSKDRSRRFFCQYCNKGFSLMNVLKVHERIHTGEKPYVCDICHKAFNQSGSLNRHKNTHLRRMEGNRTNKCRFCDKQFLYSSQLQDHEATSHRQELTSAKTSPSSITAPVASAISNNLACNSLVAQAIANSIIGGGGQNVNGSVVGGQMPGLAPSPVTSTPGGAESPIVNQIRALAAAAAKQVEEQDVTCKTCGKKCVSKEQLVMHEQEHYMSNLTGHLISAMSSHPSNQAIPGLPPLMPQAAAAAAALVSNPLSSLSRFGLNGGAGGPTGAAQMHGGPANLQQLLQIHFPNLGHHGLPGPPKTPLGAMSGGSVLNSGSSSTSSSNDENRGLEAKARSFGMMETMDLPLRVSPPSLNPNLTGGSGCGLPPLLGPLTLDMGCGVPAGEQGRPGKESITTSSSGGSLPPPSINPMILSGHHLRCAMCDRHFENAAKLHLHMRSHETNDGQKICLECKKTFNCASALKIHYRRHSGERPYTCRYCRKSFSQNGTLKRHYTTCKEARNVSHRPATDQIRHRNHLQARNENVCAGSGLANGTTSGGSIGIPSAMSASGDSSGESELSGVQDDELCSQKLMDIGPTPQPPKETVELVAQGFDMMDGPQDLSVVANVSTSNGNESDRPINGAWSPHPTVDDPDLLLRNRKRKLDESLPTSSRPGSELSPHIRDGLRDTESRPISQCSLHEIMRYLTMKNKLYRCEHCQIFFLDSALYYMHRSVHSQDAPLRCAICGYEATEKYNFHSHLMDHNKMTSMLDRQSSRDADEEEEEENEEQLDESVSSTNAARLSLMPTSE